MRTLFWRASEEWGLTFLQETHGQYVADDGRLLAGLHDRLRVLTIELFLHGYELVELFQGLQVFPLKHQTWKLETSSHLCQSIIVYFDSIVLQYSLIYYLDYVDSTYAFLKGMCLCLQLTNLVY